MSISFKEGEPVWHMMLAGLLVGEMNACRADQGKVHLGMTLGQVEKALDYEGSTCWSAGDHFGEVFIQEDFLGGEWWWCVEFLGKCGFQRVEKYTFRYTPFDHCPRWVRQVRDSFFPPEK